MFVKQEDILSATRGGLDIILHYYPQAQKALSTAKKQFKVRNEKTASATIKQLADGNYVVTDFGGDQTPRNGIQVCMYEENCSFKQAVEILAGRHNINGVQKIERKADYQKRSATADENENDFTVDIKDTMSKFELETLGKHVTAEVCKKYKFYALKSFSRVKNREVHTWLSTDDYPIYMIDGGDYKKILQPFAEKQYRFQWLGENKPKDVLFGMDQLRDAYKKHEELAFDQFNEDENRKIERMECAIIMSGDRDAINMAAYGNHVLWLNSETAKISTEQIKEISKYVKKIYNVPDIDTTGKREGVKLALTYIDICTVWLPEFLLQLKDSRGYGRKDFKDWVDANENQSRIDIQHKIDKMLNAALCAKFWFEYETEKGLQYEFSNVHGYYFLACNGFHIIKDLNAKEGYSYIHIQGNVVSKVEPREVRKFISDFVDKRFPELIKLRNMLHNSRKLSESSLSNLKEVELDFTDFDKHYQYFFFNNETWKVTADGIEHKRNHLSNFEACVWKNEVLPYNVKRLDNSFNISYDEQTKCYDIDVLNTDSKFFSYLINTSRVHWQNEDKGLPIDQIETYWNQNKFNIASSRLTDSEIWEQKQHLINKIFAIGYILHRYKNPARPWCVFAMDNKISEMSQSNGGTGKSLYFKSFNYMMNIVSLGGRDPKMTENKHIYERVTPYTDFVFVDDASKYLNFGFFFDSITGSMIVNPKNTSSFEIPFDQSPKLGIASNYTLRDIDPSTERRILYIVFSDWYHAKTENGEYEETRTVFDDFGKNLFFDYTEAEWNADINFFAECCKFFLSVPSPVKIEPPLGNVQKRNLITQMGEAFKDWADVYFTENRDMLLTKSEVIEDYIRTAKPKHVTSQIFKKCITAWCQFYGYTYNPTELGAGTDGRIIRKKDGKAIENIFIQTKEIDAVQKLLTGDATEEEKF